MISNDCINLVKQFEGCRLTAYKDVVGVLTIGYGHTGKDVKSGMCITQSVADAYLRSDLAKAEKNVMRYDDIYHWTQSQIDALTSFAFNIGSIDHLVKNGKRSVKEIEDAILLYNKAGGKVLLGLTRRREAELKLFKRNVAIKSDVPNYIVGKSYKLLAEMKVHKTPSLNGSVVKHKELSKDGQKHDTDNDGCLDNGTVITINSKLVDSAGNVWVKCPSGWICAYLKNKDKVYVI